MKETFQEYVDSDIDRNEALDQCYSLFSGFIFCSVWSGPRICFMLSCKDKICMLALLYVKNKPLD